MQLVLFREGKLIFRAKESERGLLDLEVLEGKGPFCHSPRGWSSPRSLVLEMFQHRSET